MSGFFKRGSGVLVFAVVFFAFASSAFGQATRTWQGATGGDWNTGINWSGGVAPQAGDNVIIGSNHTIINHPAIILLSLTVSEDVNLTSNAAPGNTNLITVTGTFSIAAGKTLTLGTADVGGTGFTLGATATGTIDGTLFLNSVAGTPPITINGNLTIPAAGLITGQTTSRFTLSAGATLQIANTAGITLTGLTGAVQVGGTRTFTRNSNYIYNGTAAQVIGDGLPTQSGGIGANLIIANTAGVTMTFATTVAQLTVNAGSTFTIPDTRYLASGNITMVTGSAATSITGTGDGYLSLAGTVTVVNDGGGPAGATISSLVDLGASGPRTITVADGAADADLTISGVIRNTARIVKDGAGTLVLSAANTYSGSTTVNAGIIRAGINNALAGTLEVQGGTYDIATFTDTVGAVTLLSGSIVGTTGVLTGASYNVRDGVISASLAGGGGLSKTTPGTVTLSGANTYSGTTNILAGVLRIGSTGTLPNNSAVALSGGTLSTGETTGYSDVAENLRVSGNSPIALGTGSHSLNFAGGGTWTAGRTLTITGWAGTAGTSGTSGRIFFGTSSAGLSADKLAQITFSGYAPGATILSTGEVVPLSPYRAQIISTSLGPSTWCPGDTRDISVTVRNTGALAWTDGAVGTPIIKIGVKWNTNGASWSDYYVTVPAGNLAPGDTETYIFEDFLASDNNGAYGSPLAAGINNITFDVVNEGVGNFGSNTNGLGPGNTVSTSAALTILSAPAANAGPALADICQGATSTAMGGSVSGGATGGTWSGGSGSWTNATNPATATYTASASESGTITLTLTTTGGSCGSNFVTKEITINENPTADAGGSLAAICQGGTSAVLGGSFGGAATSAIWTSNGSGTFTNNTGSTPETATYIAGAADSGTITLTLTTSGGLCGTAVANKTITVNQNPTADAGPALADICQGATSTAMGGSVGGGATGGIWSGGAGSWTNANDPATATYRAAASESGTITLTLTTTGGSCGSTLVTKEITINENPTADVGGSLSAICQGETSEVLGGSFGGSATSAVWTSNGSGTFTNNTGSTPETASYIAGAADSGTITLTLTTSGGLCGTAVANKTITVNQNPTADAGSALADICQGAISTAMGGNVGGGATGGTWSGGAGTWTNANNPSTATYTAAASESGTITLTLTTTGGSCGTATANKTITVNQNPTVSAGTTPLPAICQGGTSVALGGSFGGGATGAVWSSSGTGTFTNNTGSTPSTATYTAGPSESGNIILTLTTTGGSCGEIVRTKQITVNPTPTFTSDITSTRCSNVPTTYTATTTTSFTSFSWTRSEVGGISPATGSGSGQSATETLINTTTDPIDVVYVYTLTSNGCTFTQDVTVTVNSETVILQNPDPTGDEVCFGDGFSDISVTATGTDLAYQWYRNIDADTVSGTPIAGEVSSTFRPASTPVGVHYYYVKVRGACGTLVSELSGKYEVKPTNTYFIDNLEATETQTICYGDEFTELEVLADGIEPLSYQWYSSTSPAQNTLGTPIPGATDRVYKPLPPTTPITAAVTTYYYVRASSGCGTIQSVKTGAFRVNPTAQITNMAASVCSDGPLNVTPVHNTNGVIPAGTNYSWGIPTLDAGITGGAAGSGASINGSLTNSTSAPLTATYTVTPTTGACTGEDFTLTVTVNPTPEIPAQEQTICSGDTFTISPVDGAAGAIVPSLTTYTWTRVDNPSIAGDVNQTTAQANISGTLTNNTNSVQEVVYTVTPRSGAAGSCVGLPFTVTVTVDPKPVVPNQTLAVCSGSEFTVSPTNGVPNANTIVPANTTYTWTADDNPNVTGEGDQVTPQASISQTLINNTNVNQVVVYTVTPTSGDTGSCPGASFTVTVTVNPNPVIPDQTVTTCSGSPFTVLPVNGTPTAATIVPANTRYTWTVADNPDVTGELDQVTPQTNISQTLTNTTNVAQTVIYTVTPTSGAAGNCVGPSFQVTVTLTPALKLTSSLAPPAICSRTPFTYDPIPNITGVTIRWTRPAVPGLDNAAVTNPQSVNSTAQLINTTHNPIDVVYIYTLTANGCTNTEYVTVTVNPATDIEPRTIATTICSGDTFSVTPVDGVHGLVLPGTTYTWTVANSGFVEGELAETIPQTSISQTLINPAPDGLDREVVYSVTPQSGGCAGRPFTVRVKVLPAPTVNVPPTIGFCNGETTTPINFVGNNIPGKTYTWTNDNPSIGLAASGTGNIPAFTVSNTGGTDKIANITVTPHANGCDGTPQTFTITASAIPTVTLGADYCAVPGFVKLVASSNIPETDFEWNTVPVQYGETINVDVAGTYIVTATTPAGCQQTASISVAQELVVNGSFTAGNTGFFSGNTYVPTDNTGNNELVPEGTYAIGTNAHDYHPDFWGIDHTNNTVGPRNMMMTNTLLNTTTVWRQTVNVEANTQYYFSAWALSINPAPQYERAELQFEVNGVQVGTRLKLKAGPGAPGAANDNLLWERFYGIWSSGTFSGPVTIRIVNLEPSLSGNDFALDDISFGTLSTFLILTSEVGTDNQAVCENSPIEDISYSAGSGVDGPVVSGLPPGVTRSWNGVTLRISGTPTASGTFNYTVTTTGTCAPVTKTGTITVQSSPDAGEISGDQTICSGGDPVAFSSTAPGSSPGAGISYRWEFTNLTTPDWTAIPLETEATYDPPIVSETTQYRRITLAALNGLICESLPETSPTVTVTVQSVPTAGEIAGEQAICSAGNPGGFTSTTAGTGDGTITYRWEFTNSSTPVWTVITSETAATYDPGILSETTQYRRVTVSNLNGRICESVPTAPIQVTVQSVPTAGEIAGEQTICTDGGPITISSIDAGTGDGTPSYRWERNVSPFDDADWTTIPLATGETYDVPAGLVATTRYRRFTVSDVLGQLCESPLPTAPITITVQSVPTAGAIEGTQEICGGGDPAAFTSTTDGTGDGIITYRWEFTNLTTPVWTAIPSETEATYDPPIVSETTQYRRVTISTVNSQACESVPTLPIEVTISPNNTVTAAPSQSQCVGDPLTSITHTTTGATGIVPESATVDYNLPNGVTATWAADVITILGTPTETGVFNYSIPLTGGCGTINATGTITVTDPSYPITDIDVVNPLPGDPTPATSTFTVYSAELTPGTYTVVYSTDGVNEGPDRTITVNVTNAGRFTFTTLPYTFGGTTLLKILSIQKSTDICAYVPPYQHTAPYGLGCSEEFLSADGNDIFYVPANTYQITVQTFGTGTVSRTADVLPGDSIYVVFNGQSTFATRVPDTEPMADRITGAISSTTGPNGRIVFNYDCDPLPPCAATIDNGNQYTDSDGFTVLRFDVGSCNWTAPDGLTEFEVLIVGGGGGGGFGAAAGGGGGGEVVYQQFMDIRTGAEIGLRGATFNISVGAQGAGAIISTQQGGSGDISSFSGPAFSYLSGGTFATMSAEGGGGGGSSSTEASVRQGGSGASGGGGAAFGTSQSPGGAGSVGSDGGAGNTQAFGISGGGGGGFSGVGGSGTNNGGNVMLAGKGGIGIARPISGDTVIYGAGGGGTSSGAITNQAGAGGSPYVARGRDYFAGGGGTNNGVGQPATTYGSGGGAGSAGGSAGFPGVVYIRYPNYRILPVEYLYFDAKYNPNFRSGDLTWATANEWENERFDIERSVNTVKDWETIGQVQGAGYSDQQVNYAYQDMKLPLSGGNIFYRLKQWSFNGDSSYSDTKAIRVEAMRGTSYWKVYPNPTTGNPINLELIDNGIYHDELVTVRIIAATGQFVVIESKAGSSLNALVSENLRTKAAGVYTIEINWGIYREYHKVILRR